MYRSVMMWTILLILHCFVKMIKCYTLTDKIWSVRRLLVLTWQISFLDYAAPSTENSQEYPTLFAMTRMMSSKYALDFNSIWGLWRNSDGRSGSCLETAGNDCQVSIYEFGAPFYLWGAGCIIGVVEQVGLTSGWFCVQKRCNRGVKSHALP